MVACVGVGAKGASIIAQIKCYTLAAQIRERSGDFAGENKEEEKKK